MSGIVSALADNVVLGEMALVAAGLSAPTGVCGGSGRNRGSCELGKTTQPAQ